MILEMGEMLAGKHQHTSTKSRKKNENHDNTYATFLEAARPTPYFFHSHKVRQRNLSRNDEAKPAPSFLDSLKIQTADNLSRAFTSETLSPSSHNAAAPAANTTSSPTPDALSASDSAPSAAAAAFVK